MSNQETTEQEVPSIREETRTASQENFAKARSKAQLLEIAEALTIELTGKETKAELTAAIYAKYPAPDPALRGKSEVTNPVAEVWALAHRTFEAAAPERPRRKDIVAAGQELGIAYYTVRTQYQAWFKYTQSGTVMITAESEGLPKGLAEMLFPVEDAA